MHTGMLWFDDSQTTLTEKIKKATEFFQKKYNLTPNLCLVHPSMMEGNWPKNILELNGKTITIRAYRPVLPGHIWVGMEDEEK